MHIFGSEKLDDWLKKLGFQEGEAITHPWINRAIEKAQQKIEARNFEIRKHLLKYDDVMNAQRKAVYAQRHYLMSKEELQEECAEMRSAVAQRLLEMAIPPQSYPDQWTMQTLHEEVLRIFDLNLPFEQWAQEDRVTPESLRERLGQAIEDAYQEKERRYGARILRMAERNMLLRILDQVWKDHLHSLDHLRQGVHLRCYAQKDPLNEYKREAFILFEGMLDSVTEKVTEFLFHFEVQPETAQTVLESLIAEEDIFEDISYNRLGDDAEVLAELGGRLSSLKAQAPAVAKKPKKVKTTPTQKGKNKKEASPTDVVSPPVSRNALCPCGSKERYKNCHGKLGE